MESYLVSSHFDLITPDGQLKSLEKTGEKAARAHLVIEGISSAFVGFDLDLNSVHFNIRSSLAQIGLDGTAHDLVFDRQRGVAEMKLDLLAVGSLAEEMLGLLKPGAFIGKLFAADDRRRVRSPHYLTRMFGRSNHQGKPLLSLGGLEGSSAMVLETIDNTAIAYLSVLEGTVDYEESIKSFLPTFSKALVSGLGIREMLGLHQKFQPGKPRTVTPGRLLLVKTLPLHVRTVFARVANHLLPEGFKHTNANVLQPDTEASGDIYEFYGDSLLELSDIPLEFYTLEPHREHVFFGDRDQLQSFLEDPHALFKAFDTSGINEQQSASVFVVKGSQLHDLKPSDWIVREPHKHEFPGIGQSDRQGALAEKYIHQQPAYPFLQAISDGLITSQGVLLSTYFPSPLLKSMLLQTEVIRCLKRLYFQHPSLTHDDFFSHEDYATLNDLSTFGIPVFWVDRRVGKILQFIQKHPGDSGMFVPLDRIDTFMNATVFGVYGSNLLEGNFENELIAFFQELIKRQGTNNWPLLPKGKPLTLVTGGGPGAMEVGNRVAKTLGILSCANVVDFRAKDRKSIVNEQLQNPHVEAKMTYRLEKLFERQAEFNLDFPIFLTGGFGTDFEYALEELRRKVGIGTPTPVLLFGPADYWREKISSRFQSNCRHGTIKGSEWISNCFFAVEGAKEALHVFEEFLSGRLPLGKDSPVYDDGFVTILPKQ